ncbi:calmodulin-binding transcription activator [Musa troglodytarum]|uniref:Calmodulin-binding transcription activator n=1 Tax=Musa troglodytarum TaxID=320322 RepID=A0A9E7KSS1_9LILI|nr:calmodulin-binding transcription activator [Musa troglodytarum]
MKVLTSLRSLLRSHLVVLCSFSTVECFVIFETMDTLGRKRKMVKLLVKAMSVSRYVSIAF